MYVCVTSKESSQKILPCSTVEGEVNRTPMNFTCSFDPVTDKQTHKHLFRKTLLSVEGIFYLFIDFLQTIFMRDSSVG